MRNNFWQKVFNVICWETKLQIRMKVLNDRLGWVLFYSPESNLDDVFKKKFKINISRETQFVQGEYVYSLFFTKKDFENLCK